MTDFEFTPKPEFEGPFTIYNARDERALLRRFFDHMREVRREGTAVGQGGGGIMMRQPSVPCCTV